MSVCASFSQKSREQACPPSARCQLMLSLLFQNKAEVLSGLQGPPWSGLPLPVSSAVLSTLGSTTLAPLLFLTHTRCVHAPGLLHFPHCKCSFPREHGSFPFLQAFPQKFPSKSLLWRSSYAPSCLRLPFLLSKLRDHHWPGATCFCLAHLFPCGYSGR